MAARLDGLRRAWLNPADLVEVVPEIHPTPAMRAAGHSPLYPDRVLARDASAATLKARTLTHLYNEAPTWLTQAHAELDRAVAAAYGWPEEIGTEEALGRLLDLNRTRAAGGA